MATPLRSPLRSEFGAGWQWFPVQGVTEQNRPARVAAAMPAFLAQVQAWLPLTPALFMEVLLLLIAVRVWLWWREARHGDEIRVPVRAWRLVAVGGMLFWVGLAVVTAVSFSAM